MLGAIIGGGLGMLGSIFSGLMEGDQRTKDRAQNRQISDRNLQYQKDTQQTTWSREDNAMQRRVKDLKAAGLSATLAAGSPASTVSTTAPQESYRATQESNPVAPMATIMAQALNLTNTQMSILRQKQETSKIKTQNEILQNDLKIFKSRKTPSTEQQPQIIKKLEYGKKQIREIIKTPAGQAALNTYGKIKKDVTSSKSSWKKHKKKMKNSLGMKLYKKFKGKKKKASPKKP